MESGGFEDGEFDGDVCFIYKILFLAFLDIFMYFLGIFYLEAQNMESGGFADGEFNGYVRFVIQFNFSFFWN